MFDSPDKLDDKLHKLRLQTEVEEEQYERERYKAMTKELRKRYGHNWRAVIGKLQNNDSLRQFSENSLVKYRK